MNLTNTTLTVYPTSKSTEGIALCGDFEMTNVRRNDRIQVVCLTNNTKYWIDKESTDTKSNKDVIMSTDEANKLDAVVYTVKRGDTAVSIAQAFGVTLSSIYALNGTNKFAIGQTIRIK